MRINIWFESLKGTGNLEDLGV